MKQLLHIEKLIHGGLGLARTSEGVILVPDVLPGETVSAIPDCTIGGQKRSTAVAIVEPSPYRRKPVCDHFGICGGCDWLFYDYKMQGESKKDIFLECLSRIGKIEAVPDCEVFSSPEFGYRRRVQLKIDKEKKVLGFFKRKTWEVVDILNCPLLTPDLNGLLSDAREIISHLPTTADQIKCIAGTSHRIASMPILDNRTDETTEIRVGNYTFFVGGGDFFQSNAYLSEKLASWARDRVSGEFFADVYGGVGLFSLFLHDRFKAGVTIDNVESGVMMARRNLDENGISSVTALLDSAENFLLKSAKESAIDCLIVDPPRGGLSPQVLKAILKCPPATLLFVSCNPSTQARDIGHLIRKAGYHIDKMALFDLYPNTHHIETIVVLKR
jgi:23S rRNA (uracil1939-C5)-methyltransferase